MKLYKILVYIIVFSSISVNAQEIKVIDVPELEKIINEPSSEVKVINFWATWCKPCIEELPQFEALNNNPGFKNVEVILISLDFVEALDTRVKKFVAKKNITSTVTLLDDVDYNSWINKVDSSWSGAIPATLMIHGKSGQRKFYEKQFEPGELKQKVSDFINLL